MDTKICPTYAFLHYLLERHICLYHSFDN